MNKHARERSKLPIPAPQGNLPGVLPIYEKMEVRLFDKERARFGLMRGCLCVVEHIILADDEPPHTDQLSGEPIQLKFMPVAFLLRAVDTHWSLRHDDLPCIPATWDRRGLFLLQPATGYVRVQLDKNT